MTNKNAMTTKQRLPIGCDGKIRVVGKKWGHTYIMYPDHLNITISPERIDYGHIVKLGGNLLMFTGYDKFGGESFLNVTLQVRGREHGPDAADFNEDEQAMFLYGTGQR